MPRITPNLVRRMPYMTKCETYTCNNMASFEIGHIITRSETHHYCKECMEQIFEEAREILAENQKNQSVNIYDNETRKVVTVVHDNNNDNEEKSAKEEEIPFSEEAEEVTEIKPKKVEFYMCRHCGKRFDKPEELNAYRSHLRTCKGAE